MNIPESQERGLIIHPVKMKAFGKIRFGKNLPLLTGIYSRGPKTIYTKNANGVYYFRYQVNGQCNSI
jgi:hypothetical protein